MAAAADNQTTTAKEKYEVICPTEDELKALPSSENVCPVIGCGKCLKNSSALKLHIVKVHKVGTAKEISLFNRSGGMPTAANAKQRHFYCPVKGCPRDLNHKSRPFKKLFMLKMHYLNLHADKVFICVKCKKAFGNPKRLSQHESTCGQVYNCSCGTPYATKEALVTHARRAGHSIIVNMPNDCGKASTSVATLVIPKKPSYVPILPKPGWQNAVMITKSKEGDMLQSHSNAVDNTVSSARNVAIQATEREERDSASQALMDFGSQTQLSLSCQAEPFWDVGVMQTQTDLMNDVMTSAFTQTGLQPVENQSCQTYQESVTSDTQTQTPVSFSDLLLQFERAFENSTSMPDLTTAYTQTSRDNPMHEFLDYTSQETQTQVPNDLELVEVSNSCTQTFFNDLMADSLTDTSELTLSSDMETQTNMCPGMF